MDLRNISASPQAKRDVLSQRDPLTGPLTSAEAASVAEIARRYIRAHYRALPEQEDLVQETLVGLLQHLAGRGNPTLDPDQLAAIALTILKRRIADRFRQSVRSIVDTLSPEALPSVAHPLTTENVVSQRKMLLAVLVAILELSEEDRDLVMRGELSGSERDGPLTTAQRKRVSRIRMRLKDILAKRFGLGLETFSLDG